MACRRVASKPSPQTSAHASSRPVRSPALLPRPRPAPCLPGKHAFQVVPARRPALVQFQVEAAPQDGAANLSRKRAERVVRRAQLPPGDPQLPLVEISSNRTSGKSCLKPGRARSRKRQAPGALMIPHSPAAGIEFRPLVDRRRWRGELQAPAALDDLVSGESAKVERSTIG